MNNHVDLHIHTTASDGLHTPTEIVEMSRSAGLNVIAISDHDTVGGVAEALSAAEGKGLEVIPGVEISTDADHLELHILGYYVNYGDTRFAVELVRLRASRLERAQLMLSKLRSLGVTLSWERVCELAGEGAVGRPHIARALQEAHHVSSAQEAFDRYLGRGKPAYVPRLKLTPVEAMRLVRRAGGVPVLAHPWGIAPIVPELAREGLVGLEAYYTGYSPEITAHLCKVAEQHHLICTGGSDFHGLSLLPDNRLGLVHVPDECARALRERRQLTHDTNQDIRRTIRGTPTKG